MVAVRLLCIFCILLVAGCATSPVPLGIPCNVFSDDGKHGFEPDKGASTRWTRGEKEQLVSLNETGERLCRWRAPA